MTPNAKTAAVAMSSTKMTKGERLHSSHRQVEVSRFTFDRQSSAAASTAILADILAEEERLAEMKRQLLYRPDYDLELIYEQKGRQLEEILNHRYGSCNFTSFVRYLVPQDYEHRYLAFIKHQPQNRLTPETAELIDRLVDEEYAKEAAIRNWWEEIDREMVFRGYCRPGDKHIPAPEVTLSLCSSRNILRSASADCCWTASIPTRPAPSPTNTSPDTYNNYVSSFPLSLSKPSELSRHPLSSPSDIPAVTSHDRWEIGLENLKNRL
jgi:hypothetical protein